MYYVYFWHPISSLVTAEGICEDHVGWLVGGSFKNLMSKFPLVDYLSTQHSIILPQDPFYYPLFQTFPLLIGT